MKRFAQILLILAMGALCGVMDAQTNTPTGTITVAAAKVAAVASVTPATLNLAPGATGTLVFTVKAPSGSSAVPTGSVDLLAKPSGSSVWTLVSNFVLSNGTATCTYPIPTSTPLGTYDFAVAYSGDSNYLPSPEFQ